MYSLEKEVKDYFEQRGILFNDNSDSFEKLDFGFGDRNTKRYFSFDVKEKRQRYNMNNWQVENIPEEYFFIIDDLAARKILAYAPNSGIIVRDNLHHRYFLFTVVALYLMPKRRVNRPIKKQVATYKGKWLIDLKNGQMFDGLADVFEGIEAYLADRENIFLHILECYGDYVGEDIGEGGIVRAPKHWKTDVDETR